MFKKILLNICLLAFTRPLSAQVTNAHVLFQYSMNPFQPTALPYNYLDKHERKPTSSKLEKGTRTDQKIFNGWYFNASTRSELHPQSGVTSSSIISVDRLKNPNELNLKIGGGLAYQDLDLIQIVSPYVHVSVGHPIGDNWRILGGAGFRFSSQQMNRNNLLFKDIDDPKIPAVLQMYNSSFTTAGISAAIVDIRKMYIGIGYNRILLGDPFQSANRSSFSEANLLVQYSLKLYRLSNYRFDMESRTGYASNPNRGLFSNMNLSLATRYVMNAGRQHPLHAQFNCRVTLTPLFWGGLGWNTANRTQLQLGLLKIPVLQDMEAKREYQLWVAYDLPSGNTPRHGVEMNLGYYF